jgi:ferredoxin-NADP reductase
MDKFYWQIAEVLTVTQETPRVKTITLQLPHWIPHLPGQHYDIRLTAEDGYQAQRSYSVASPPAQSGQIDLTVELLAEGEVSTYLHEGIAPGDLLELRGPIGGYFVWRDDMKNIPLLLVAGGSGVVPLMAILRHRAKIGATSPTTLLYSIRTENDVIYQHELRQLAHEDINFKLVLTFTRQPPPGWRGYRRRIDRLMLTEILNDYKFPPLCYICGPNMLVEQVANTLLDIGLPAQSILTERFSSAKF